MDLSAPQESRTISNAVYMRKNPYKAIDSPHSQARSSPVLSAHPKITTSTPPQANGNNNQVFNSHPRVLVRGATSGGSGGLEQPRPVRHSSLVVDEPAAQQHFFRTSTTAPHLLEVQLFSPFGQHTQQQQHHHSPQQMARQPTAGKERRTSELHSRSVRPWNFGADKNVCPLRTQRKTLNAIRAVNQSSSVPSFRRISTNTPSSRRLSSMDDPQTWHRQSGLFLPHLPSNPLSPTTPLGSAGSGNHVYFANNGVSSSSCCCHGNSNSNSNSNNSSSSRHCYGGACLSASSGHSTSSSSITTSHIASRRGSGGSVGGAAYTGSRRGSGGSSPMALAEFRRSSNGGGAWVPPNQHHSRTSHGQPRRGSQGVTPEFSHHPRPVYLGLPSGEEPMA